MPKRLSDRLLVPRGKVDLSTYDARAKPGFKGKSGKKDKKQGKAALVDMDEGLSDLQERLFAEGLSGGSRSVLLVLQGMDTSGKGGTIRHAVALVDPQGVDITSFKAPTAAERRHDFLWRIERELPQPGYIGVFDRSHYEDVLVPRVHKTVARAEIAKRYTAINRFEKQLVDDGTVVVKLMLHISEQEQRERLLARLDDPTKHWKYDPGDVDERAYWDDYQEAFERAIEKTNTTHAPWIVVPSDRKWFRNLAVATILRETLESMALRWPEADFDVAEQRARLAGS